MRPDSGLSPQLLLVTEDSALNNLEGDIVTNFPIRASFLNFGPPINQMRHLGNKVIEIKNKVAHFSHLAPLNRTKYGKNNSHNTFHHVLPLSSSVQIPTVDLFQDFN